MKNLESSYNEKMQQRFYSYRLKLFFYLMAKLLKNEHFGYIETYTKSNFVTKEVHTDKHMIFLAFVFVWASDFEVV